MNEKKRAEILAIIKDVEAKFGISSSATELEAQLSQLTPEKILRAMEQDFRRTLEEMVVPAAASAGQDAKSLARRIKHRTLLDTSVINASAHKSQIDGSYAICVNLGLTKLVGHFFRLLSLHVGLMGVDGKEPIAPKATLKDAVPEARTMVEFFRSNRILDYNGIPVFGLQKHQIQFCGLMSNAAERFIVGHELGHVVHWEAGKDHASLKLGRNCCEVINRKLLKGQLPKLKDELVENWHQEFGADYCGLVFGLKLQKDSWGQAAAVAGAEGVLLILKLLEEFGTKQGNPWHLYQTHPPAEARLGALRMVLQMMEAPPFFLELGKGLELLLKQITEKL